MSVVSWETVTMLGESVYRIGPESRAETHRGWGRRGLTVSVGRKNSPSRDTLAVTLEEAELLALALAEAVSLSTEEEEL